MKKNAVLFTLALLISPLTATSALADEVWSTEEYDVIYQEDRNRTAVWSYGPDGREGTIFIEGLAGVTAERGSYLGYWVQESSSLRCDTYREDINGEPTYHWGRFEVTFIDSDFPSRWHAHFGLCDRETTIPLNGTPITR
ncbi:MAG: hypothetical protein WBC73_20070 [Phormidesmis sp.]